MVCFSFVNGEKKLYWGYGKLKIAFAWLSLTIVRIRSRQTRVHIMLGYWRYDYRLLGGLDLKSNGLGKMIRARGRLYWDYLVY